MRFAVISDVQGNLHALEAALEAIEGYPQRIERIVAAGDIVGRGPQPNEVINLLRERGIESVRGNYDDAVAFDRIGSGSDFADAQEEEIDAQALEWTRGTLTPANLTFLRDLPRDLRLFRGSAGIRVKKGSGDERASEYRRTFILRALFGGLAREGKSYNKRIMIVHGSPRAMNEFIRADTANTILANVSAEAQTDILVTGHAAASFQREAKGITFIGVGPVSGPEAEFAVVNVTDAVSTDFLSAPYDVAGYTRALMESGLPPSLVPSPE